MTVLSPEKPLSEYLKGHGTIIDLAGNKPLLLTSPEEAFVVSKGQVELFLVALSEGLPLGPRYHLATIAEGGLLLGCEAVEYGFLAVGQTGGRIMRIDGKELRELGRSTEMVKVLAPALDVWVAALSQGMADWVSPRPMVESGIGSGETIELGGGRRCCGQGGTAWLSVEDDSVLFLDVEDIPADTNRAFPLTSETWLMALGTTTLTARNTEDALFNGLAWPGVAGLQQLLLESAEMNLRLANVDEHNRLQARVAATEAKRRSGFAALAGVVDRGVYRHAAVADSNALVAALRRVGKWEGFSVRFPPSASSQDEFDLDALVEASGLRSRRVLLRDGWWQADFGALLGFEKESGRPLALLFSGRGRVRAIEPVSRVDVPLTNVDPEAVELLPGLAYRPLNLRDLAAFAAPRGWQDGSMAVLAGGAVGLLGMAVPIATGYLVDTVIPGHEQGKLIEVGIVLCALAVTGFFMSYVGTLSFARAEGRVGRSLQAAMMDRLLRLPISFFRRHSVGDLASRVTAITRIQILISTGSAAGLLGGLFAAFSFGLMFVYDSGLALWATLLTILYALFSLGFAWMRLRHERPLANLEGDINGAILQMVLGIAKIRLSASEDRAFARWARVFAKGRRHQLSAENIGALQATINGIFAFVGLFLFVLMIGKPTEATNLVAVGAFAALLIAFQNFAAAITLMTQVMTELVAVQPLMERIRPLLVEQPEVDEAKEFPGALSGAVEVSRVTFRYGPDDPAVLDDVSLKAMPGDFIALVGPSGSGKSTLMRLLLGFEKPETGGVLFDGQDLGSLDIPAVRRQMGVVMQSAQPMPGSLFDNIVGAAGGSLDDAWEAAERVGLAEDIRQMPMGMHTVVLEGGGALSGGQIQRLMIARAIVDRPKILLLDEATSALDNRTQAIVTESLDRLKVTRIVVAHRLSTVINADRIHVLDGGKIVEAGTYSKLMKMNGVFTKLAERQMV